MTEDAPIDDWARAALFALADWAESRGGRWVRVAGRPVLRFEAEGGSRLSVRAEEGELLVSVGLWEQPLPEEQGPYADPLLAAKEAMALVESWLGGGLVIAELFGGDDRWCGALAIRPDQEAIDAQLAYAAEALARFEPAYCALRAARPGDQRRFEIRDGRIESA